MELNDVDRKVIDFMIKNPGKCGCSACGNVVSGDVWGRSVSKLIACGIVAPGLFIEKSGSALLKLAALGYSVGLNGQVIPNGVE